MDKRTTLALLLMAALLMIYPAIFMRSEPEQKAAPKTEAPASPAKAPEPGASATPAAPAVASSPPAKEAPAVPERTAVVETPLYRAVVSSSGGQSQSWELRYRGQKPMVFPGALASKGLVVVRPGQPARPIALTLSREKLAVGPGTPSGELVLTGEDG